MKKIILAIILITLFTPIANASSNKLTFNKADNKLYYYTEQEDKDTFLNREDMIAGQVYKDEMIIENGSDTEFDLYLKVNETDKSNNLLDQIHMKIELDGKEIYNGTARWEESGEESIYLGKYKPSDSKNLVVTTELDKNYNSYTSEEASIDWDLYAEYDLEAPATGDSIIKHILILILGILFISTEIVIVKKTRI